MLRKFAFAAAALAATPAFAHHPMGGMTPQTLSQGFLSGLGHPVIGLDHFAFIVAMGLAAAFTAHKLLTPLAFIAATVVGCLLAFSGVAMPAQEFVVAGSVALIGGAVLSGRSFGAAALLALFAVAGLFHGAAYAEAIVGADSAVVGSYLVGFGLIQYAVAAAVALAASRLWASSAAIAPRLAGAMIAGVGVTFLLENAEKLAFPGL